MKSTKDSFELTKNDGLISDGMEVVVSNWLMSKEEYERFIKSSSNNGLVSDPDYDVSSWIMSTEEYKKYLREHS
ncbi:MAG: hypothetical protein ACRBBR_04695 [Cellvibrionaceae bacterium]